MYQFDRDPTKQRHCHIVLLVSMKLQATSSNRKGFPSTGKARKVSNRSRPNYRVKGPGLIRDCFALKIGCPEQGKTIAIF